MNTGACAVRKRVEDLRVSVIDADTKVVPDTQNIPENSDPFLGVQA
jgi:hypothetical protein